MARKVLTKFRPGIHQTPHGTIEVIPRSKADLLDVWKKMREKRRGRDFLPQSVGNPHDEELIKAM